MKIFIYSILIVGLLAVIYDLFLMRDVQRQSLCKIRAERQFLLLGSRGEFDKDICLSLEDRKEKYTRFCAHTNKFSKNTFCKVININN